MGNARGVINSRNHVSLNPDNPADKKDFFDFTFEDIGMKDLPAMIDYVLDFTRKSQLHYIGHSQGGTTFLVLNSMLPGYNQKIASAHLLAGVGYQKHFPHRLLSLAAISTQAIYVSLKYNVLFKVKIFGFGYLSFTLNKIVFESLKEVIFETFLQAVAVRLGLIEILGPEWNNLDLGDCNENESCGLFNIAAIMVGILDLLNICIYATSKHLVISLKYFVLGRDHGRI